MTDLLFGFFHPQPGRSRVTTAAQDCNWSVKLFPRSKRLATMSHGRNISISPESGINRRCLYIGPILERGVQWAQQCLNWTRPYLQNS